MERYCRRYRRLHSSKDAHQAMMTPTQQIAANTFLSHPAFTEIAGLMNELLLGPKDISVTVDVEEGGNLSVVVKGPLGAAVLLIAYDKAAVDLATARPGSRAAN